MVNATERIEQNERATDDVAAIDTPVDYNGEQLTPFDILAQEMGAVAARMKREMNLRISLGLSQLNERELQRVVDGRKEMDELRRELADLRVEVAALRGPR